MSDIATRIRDHYESVVEPVGVDEIFSRALGPEPVRPLQRRRQRLPIRGWARAVVAAVALLLLVGSAALLIAVTGSDTPVADTVPTTLTESTPTTLTESTPTTLAESEPTDLRGCLNPATWTRVCDDAAGFDGAAMFSVTTGGPGLVAVGGEDFVFYNRWESERTTTAGTFNGGEADAVVWTSPDGASWTRIPHDEAVFGGDGEQQMFDVTFGGPGLVAVGLDATFFGEEGNAAVWTSTDGFTWTRVPHDEAVFGGEGEQRMVSVTVGGPGLVAVGIDGPANSEEGNAAVWTSTDGFTWSRVPDDEAVFGGESRQMMLSVTVGGPGLVAVGSDGHPFDIQDRPIDELAADAAVWTSPDGFSWSRVPHDEAVFGGEGRQMMLSVTVGGPGLVAVGATSGDIDGVNPGRENADAAVWTSPDGFTWSRVPHDRTVFGVSGDEGGTGEEAMLDVTAGDSGLVAVGFTGFDELGWDEAVWTSPDGITWTRLPQAPGGNNAYDRMLSVTVGGSGLVAVGEMHGDGQVAAVWVAVPEDR